MLNATALAHLRTSTLFTLALSTVGAFLAGCTIIVDDHGHGHDEEDAWERCYDEYDDCLDEADGDMQAVLACGDQLNACTGSGDSHGDPTTGGSQDSAGDGQGDGQGVDEVPAAEVCVSLHQTCIAGADDLADTLACEALFEHCANPGQCQEPCPKDCPEAGIAACLADYGGCVAGATKDYQVEACNLVFDGCITDLGAGACLPEDDAHVDACLAEHALCTACAEGDAELAACKDIFDACLVPPM